MGVIESMIAFNAGFSVLKNTIQNGREIGGVLGSLANMIGAEEDLRARGNRKKSSIWSKAFGKDADIMEEFQALQDIKRKRAELKFMIQLMLILLWTNTWPMRPKCGSSGKNRHRNERRPSLNWLVIALGVQQRFSA